MGKDNAIQVKVKFVGISGESWQNEFTSELEKLQNSLKPIKLKVQLVDTNLQQQANLLGGNFNTNINTPSIDSGNANLSGNVERVSTTFTALGDVVKKVTTSVDGLGRSLKVVTDEGEEVIKIVETVTNPVTKANAAIDDMARKIELLSHQGKITKEQLEKFNIELQRIRTLGANETGEALKKLSQDISLQQFDTSKLNKLNETYDLIKARLRNLEQQGKLSKDQIRRFNEELQRINNLPVKEQTTAFKGLQQSISDTGKRAQSFGQQLKNAFEKFSVWIGVATIVMQAVRFFKSAVTNVVELDKSLVELNKVADLSAKQLENVTNRAFELGKTVSRTGKEVLDAVVTFKKAGYNIDESFDLSYVALTMTNVADGITDVKEAAGSLISILKGLNKEVTYAQYALDLINYTSNNFAIDADNLTDILERATSTLAQSGNTYEQIVGMGTAIYEVTRNAEKTGSALNFISTRMRAVTEEGEDNAELLSKIADTLQKYANVNVYDENQELRSTYDILKDLSKIYGSLTKSVQGYINQALAGVRQSPQLVALLNNFATAESVVAESSQAVGSALEEQIKYTESIEGRINNLKSAFSSMSREVVSSPLVKGAISFLQGLLKHIDALGGFGTLLTRWIAILILIKKEKVITFFKGLGTVLQGIKKTTGEELPQSLKKTGDALKETGKTAETAGKSFSSFNVWVIAITVAITALVAIFKSVKEAQEKAIETSKALSENAIKEVDEIDELIDNYISLAGKINKTASEMEELNTVGEKLAKTYGILNGITDFGNKSYEEQLEIIKELNQAKSQELKEAIKEQSAYVKALEQTAKSSVSQFELLSFPLEQFTRRGKKWGYVGEQIASELAPLLATGHFETFVQELTKQDPEKALKYLKTLRELASAEGWDTGGVINWMTGYTGAVKILNEQILELTDAVNIYKEQFDKLNSLQAEYNVTSEETTAEIELLLSKFNSLPISSVNEDLETQAKLIDEVREKLNKWASGFSNASEETIKEVNKVVELFEKQVEIVEKSDPLLEYLNEKLSNLKKIQENQKKELETQEKLLAIEKAREELAKAKMKRTLVLTREGWKYQESAEDVQEAQKNLDDAIKNANLDDMSQAIENIGILTEMYSQMVLEKGEVVRGKFLDAQTSTAWINASYEDKLAFINSLMGENWVQNYLQGLKATTSADIHSYIPTHHNGGIVGGINTSAGEQITKLLKGEYVLNDRQQRRLISLVGNRDGETPSINIGEVILPGVSDAQGFINEIVKIASEKIVTSRKKTA